MNATRWVADLACGHETWVTRKSRPTANRLSCPKCDGGKKAKEEGRRMSDCLVMAGLCEKVSTVGEPHYCGNKDFHVGKHQCRACGIRFTCDMRSLIVKKGEQDLLRPTPRLTGRLTVWDWIKHLVRREARP